MAKAQSFFGGTSRKDNTDKVRQVGHIGKVQSKTGKITFVDSKQPRPEAQKTNIKWVDSKQVGTTGSR